MPKPLKITIKNIIPFFPQKFDKNDYRLVRFIDKEKHVNKQFAINLIDEVPPKPCKERVVWCDGGSGPEGHPKVFINLVSIVPPALTKVRVVVVLLNISIKLSIFK